MQKFFYILAFLFLFLCSLHSVAAAEKFVVTAYYSPLPDQEYYVTGSYEKEKILQGHGIRGASGRKVFSGMLAAPKSYDFGTKIYLEGLGVGDVQDRGGAIVPAGERGYKHDRIDVWMGYGDEGLKRALTWGKRTVAGEIIASSSATTIDYKRHAAPDSAVAGLQKQKKNIFTISVGKESPAEDIQLLQTLLREAGVYTGEIDGVYNDEIVEIIFDFQVVHGIVSTASDLGAGYWGPKTQKAFETSYKNGDLRSLLDKESQAVAVKNTEKNSSSTLLYDGTAESRIQILQAFREKGLYTGKDRITEQAFYDVIYQFQLAQGIVTSVSDVGAGYFGPATRKAFAAYQKPSAIKKLDKIDESEDETRTIDTVISLRETIGNPSYGDSSESVRKLQELLDTLGYFDHYSTTGYFGEVTKEAVIKFQLENNLIENRESIYAGVVGDRTLETLITNYINN